MFCGSHGYLGPWIPQNGCQPPGHLGGFSLLVSAPSLLDTAQALTSEFCRSLSYQEGSCQGPATGRGADFPGCGLGMSYMP